VGGVSEFTPFNVVGPDGQLTGMDREIVRAAAKRLGIKQVEFKTMAFSKLGQSLLDGKIDLIANNYWPTPDRERLYAFTMPYFTRGGVGSLWIEGTGPFDSAASMAGRRIATFKGSYPEAWTQEHVPTATILPVDGTSAELDDTLQTGRADVVVGFLHATEGRLAETRARPWIQERASPTDAGSVRSAEGLEGATRGARRRSQGDVGRWLAQQNQTSLP
jgi:ABC-type amino acid transport substrate-binding protein